MARIPRISDNQMARYLQRKGFVITQRKGSHMTFRNVDLVTVVPAGNKKLRIKTQFSIEFMINRPKNKIRKICQIFY